MCIHRLFIRFNFIFHLLLFVSFVFAQPQNISRVGQYQLSSRSFFERNLVVQNDLAYITGQSIGQSYGLMIINTVNPDSTFLIGRLGGMGTTRGIIIQNQYAFITSPDSGLYIVDISNPNLPSLASYLPLFGAARFTIDSNYAYISTWGSDTSTIGLSIVNISNPPNPILTGFCTSEAPFGIRVCNGYAFLASSPGIVVVDISNPTHPVIVGSASIAFPDGIALQGSYAYLATDSGLCVVDISIPIRPTPVGHYYSNNLSVWTTDVAIHNNLAFLTQWGIGLRVIDVSNPFSPTLVGENDLPLQDNLMHSVFVNDSWAYTAEARYLGIFDYSNLLSIPESSHPTLPTTFSLADPYPNPFNASTLIKFDLPQMTRVNLQVFDALGRKVSTLADAPFNAGSYRWQWNGTGMASGNYFIRMTLPGQVVMKKVVLVK